MSEPVRLVIVGGSDAGISAGLRARELDPAVQTTLVVADAYPNFSICGIPYWLSGEVTEAGSLAHRTREDLERAGLQLRLNTVAERIDVERRELIVRGLDGASESIGYDRLVIGTGAIPARPPIPGIELEGVHVERLRVDLAIHRISVELAELGGIHIVGIQNPFTQVGVGAVVVIVRREHVHLRADPDGGSRH